MSFDINCFSGKISHIIASIITICFFGLFLKSMTLFFRRSIVIPIFLLMIYLSLPFFLTSSVNISAFFLVSIFSIIVPSYIIGSIPCGFIVTRCVAKFDIRNIGSGNTGATNVTRALGIKYGILTFILDVAKAFLIVFLATVNPLFGGGYAGRDAAILCVTIFGVLGHIFPTWLRFKGGKGVAVAVAFFYIFDWRLGLIFSVIWIIVFVVWRYVSLASILSTLSAMILTFFFKSYALLDYIMDMHVATINYATSFNYIDTRNEMILNYISSISGNLYPNMNHHLVSISILIIGCIVIAKHYTNIVRLINGIELSFGK